MDKNHWPLEPFTEFDVIYWRSLMMQNIFYSNLLQNGNSHVKVMMLHGRRRVDGGQWRPGFDSDNKFS